MLLGGLERRKETFALVDTLVATRDIPRAGAKLADLVPDEIIAVDKPADFGGD